MMLPGKHRFHVQLANCGRGFSTVSPNTEQSALIIGNAEQTLSGKHVKHFTVYVVARCTQDKYVINANL